MMTVKPFAILSVATRRLDDGSYMSREVPV